MSIYSDGLLLAILRPGVTPANVYSEMPDGWLALMPLVYLDVIPRGVADPRFPSTRVLVQVDAYATQKRPAWVLAANARQVLFNAHRLRTVTADGWLGAFGVQSEPEELRLPEQASGFYRYNATYALTLRA